MVESVDANRVVIKADKPSDSGRDPGIDIYNLTKYQRSNQNTCINQKPIVHEGDHIEAGEVIADGASTEMGELALGRNVLVAFMPWGGYNFEDSILISERVVKEDYFTSVHIEEFECVARDTKLGPEEITRDIPNVGEEALKDLDESGIIRIGAEVRPGDILVGKITPKGETQLSPEEKLLRAIFGEKAGEVRDTSLKVPPGVEGTVINARVFSRKGVSKDERSQAIEDEEIAKLKQDQQDEQRITRESTLKKVRKLLVGKDTAARLTDDSAARCCCRRASASTPESLDQIPPTHWGEIKIDDEKIEEEVSRIVEAMQEQLSLIRMVFQEKIERLKGGDELAAGRHQDGEGLRRHQAQAAGRRQDGRPARQQGRAVADPARRGHAVSRGRDAGGHGPQPARRAVANERRPDPRNPPRLGEPRPLGVAIERMTSTADERRSNCASG